MSTQDIIVIGGSAGGLEALASVLGRLPPGFGGSIFAVLQEEKYANIIRDMLSKTSLAPEPAAPELDRAV